MLTRNAFTLIETLLGVLIASVIGLCMFNMLVTGIKVSESLRWVKDNHQAYLTFDALLTKDLENAVSLDLSASYPDMKLFDGKTQAMAFLTKTPYGIRRVSYLVDGHARLVRQEMTLAHWVGGQRFNDAQQILIRHMDRAAFKCRYAAFDKDIYAQGINALSFKDAWEDAGLPMVVNCTYAREDQGHTTALLRFDRMMFTSPVWEK